MKVVKDSLDYGNFLTYRVGPALMLAEAFVSYQLFYKCIQPITKTQIFSILSLHVISTLSFDYLFDKYQNQEPEKPNENYWESRGLPRVFFSPNDEKKYTIQEGEKINELKNVYICLLSNGTVCLFSGCIAKYSGNFKETFGNLIKLSSVYSCSNSLLAYRTYSAIKIAKTENMERIEEEIKQNDERIRQEEEEHRKKVIDKYQRYSIIAQMPGGVNFMLEHEKILRTYRPKIFFVFLEDERTLQYQEFQNFVTFYETPFKLFGIDRNANKQQIKTAYKRLALLLHPDKIPIKYYNLQYIKVEDLIAELNSLFNVLKEVYKLLLRFQGY